VDVIAAGIIYGLSGKRYSGTEPATNYSVPVDGLICTPAGPTFSS